MKALEKDKEYTKRLKSSFLYTSLKWERRNILGLSQKKR